MYIDSCKDIDCFGLHLDMLQAGPGLGQLAHQTAPEAGVPHQAVSHSRVTRPEPVYILYHIV